MGLIVQQPHVQGDDPEDEDSELDDEDEDL
jgi:hypothetical protein